MENQVEEKAVEYSRSSAEVFSPPQELDRTPSIDDSIAPESKPESNLVTWDGPNDPRNPKNWPSKRKWAAVFCGTSGRQVHMEFLY